MLDLAEQMSIAPSEELLERNTMVACNNTEQTHYQGKPRNSKDGDQTKNRNEMT